MRGTRGHFACARCGFAATVEAQGAHLENLKLFCCPLCKRFPSRFGFAVTLVGWAFLVSVPISFFTLIFAFFVAMDLHVSRTPFPFVVTAVFVAAIMIPAMVHRWRKKHREVATMVQLRRFWEWRLPAGPWVIATQDAGSGEDAVWIDGTRAAQSEVEGGYLIPLHTPAHAATGDPYRAAAAPAKLRFPADGTCWLTLGGKRIEPVSTSSDVV